MGYPSDLTDREWDILEPLMPAPKHMGRPRKHDFRSLLNGIFYVDRTGCQWRYLPKDLPQWDSVYHYFRKFRRDGTLERIHAHLRRQVRIQAGREPEPSAAIIDSQSVKTLQKGGREDTTEIRRSKAEKSTSSWILWN